MNRLNQIILVLLAVFAMSCSSPRPNYTIFLAGDSTMAWKPDDKRPETGWGMLLPNYLNDNVSVDNRAINGMSTYSFKVEGFWDKLIAEVKEGDYVFIQFGHNDTRVDRKDRYASPEDYKKNLIKFIDETRAKGATPVLLTSIERRNFDVHGVFKPAHGIYPIVMRKVAKEEDVLLLDICADSGMFLQEKGAEASRDLFLIAPAGQWTNYPNGISDNTHLNVEGAKVITEMIIGEIKQSSLDIAKDLKE